MKPALTRKEIEAMREPELRTHVLAPLFRAMGFRDVVVWHGGVLEQGKDIVMWKAADDGSRLDYAVVAKTGRISGAASGHGSAAEVLFQIQQALRVPYLDQVTGESRIVQRVWVVTNGRILKEAVSAIRGALHESERPRVEQFIDMERLWQLLNEYDPRRTVVDRLQAMGRELGDTVDDLQVRAEVRAGTTSLFFSPSPNARELPEISASLSVGTEGTIGRANLQALRKHHETGEAATLHDVGLSLHLPPEMRQLIGELPARGTVELGPRRRTQMLTCRPQFATRDGRVLAFDPVHLSMTRGGTEELVLEGSDAVGWKWVIVQSRADAASNIQVRISLASRPAVMARQLVQMMDDLSKGGRLWLTDALTGKTLLDGVVPAGAIPAPPEWLVTVVSWALEVEQGGGPAFQLPEGAINASDLALLQRIWQIVTIGEESARVSKCTFLCSPAAQETLATEAASGITLVAPIPSPAPIVLWGNQFEPGPAEIAIRGLHRIAVSDAAPLRDLSAESMAAEIPVHLSFADDLDNARVRYSNWPQKGEPT